MSSVNLVFRNHNFESCVFSFTLFHFPHIVEMAAPLTSIKDEPLLDIEENERVWLPSSRTEREVKPGRTELQTSIASRETSFSPTTPYFPSQRIKPEVKNEYAVPVDVKEDKNLSATFVEVKQEFDEEIESVIAAGMARKRARVRLNWSSVVSLPKGG